MQTEQEIQKIAEEMAGDMIAAGMAKRAAREKAKRDAFGSCKQCGFHLVFAGNKGMKRCSKCRAYQHENGKFDFVFPEWAQGKKQFFRRAFCLVFNIQGK